MTCLIFHGPKNDLKRFFCVGSIGVLVGKKGKTFTTTKVARDSVARFSSVPSLEESEGAVPEVQVLMSCSRGGGRSSVARREV